AHHFHARHVVCLKSCDDVVARMDTERGFYRLEAKNVVRRVKKIGNAHIFEALVSRDAARGRLIDELVSFFGGQGQPVVARLIETGKLSLEDVKDAERTLRRLARKDTVP
ncbi:MAG TPA: hypothetical protein EYO88_12735, partial [Alphaproteobacteria bacterium]|nr:hypothetical protein [Alphaproteobacteria bacterium]